MKILWTNNAKVNLGQIRKAHSKSTVLKINLRTKDLLIFPLMGQKEEFYLIIKQNLDIWLKGILKLFIG